MNLFTFLVKTLKNCRPLLLLAMMMAMATVGFGQTIVTTKITNTGTWTVPSGVASVTVGVWGGGGGGGGAASTTGTRGGGGGGGGGYSQTVWSVTSGNVYNVTVGAGGPGGSGSTNGTNGGTSTVTGAAGTISAAGGLQGIRNNGAGGAGGVGVTFSGGSGFAGSSFGGGGGGGAGNLGNGANATTGATTAAGGPGSDANGTGANGGTGRTGDGDGIDAAAPSGGGGGARKSAIAGSQTGGDGGKGQVLLTYLQCSAPSGGTMNGTIIVCTGGTYAYTVSGIGGGAPDNYTWAVPGDWTINSGQGTTSINVTAGSLNGTIQCTPSQGICNGTIITKSVSKDVTAPTADAVTVDASCWVTDGTNNYTIVAKSTDGGTGFNGAGNGIEVRINEGGPNAGTYGGYFAWHPANYIFAGDNVVATGAAGGFASKDNSGSYGDAGISLVSCSTSVSGNQVTVYFVVQPNASFPALTVNDISLQATDACGNQVAWTNFATAFTSTPTAFDLSNGTVDNDGPIDFCDAGGSWASDIVSVSGAGVNGTIYWQYGLNNGTWADDVTGASPSTSVFVPKTNNSDGLQKDKVRWNVRNGGCVSAYSDPILINNHYNDDPTSLTASYNSCSDVAVSGTLTAHFASATDILGSVEFFSGSCGGTLLATVACNGSTTISTPVTVPVGTTSYFARYNPGTGTNCAPDNCATVDATVNTLPAAPSITYVDASGTTSNDGTICRFDAITLDAGSYTNYLWNTGATTQTISPNPSVTTTYSVIGYDVNGCSASSNGTVTVNQLPTPLISVTESSGNSADDGTICIDAAPTVLDAGAYSSYVWDNSETTQTITVQPLTTTSYTVIVTDANVCSAPATRTITVHPLPIPAITVAETSGNANDDGTICVNASATLDAGAFTGYAWDGGATTRTINVSPVVTTTYTVTVTNSNGCTQSTTFTINVNTNPAAPVIGITDASGTTVNDAIICRNDNVTLDAGSYTVYAWSNGQTGQTITVSPTGNTTYTVTGYDANHCFASTSQAVIVNQLPTPSIGVTENSGNSANNGTICIDAEPTVLDAGAYTSFVWNNSETTQTITIQPLTTTSYTVIVTDANVCSAPATRTITVNPLPTPAISVTENSGYLTSDNALCAGDEATLNAGSFVTYLWSTSSTNGTIVVSPGSTTTYSVTVKDVNGCFNSTSSTVTVNALPSAPVITVTETSGTTNDDGTICSGSVANLSSDAHDAYSWAPGGATTQSVNVTPTITTTYTVRGFDANGCFVATSTTITVENVPTAVIVTAPGTYCNVNTLNASGGIGGLIYYQGTTSNGTDETNQTTTANVTASGTYYFRAKNVCGWGAEGSITVTNLTPPAPVSIDGATAQCPNTTGQVYSVAAVAGATTYTWQVPVAWNITGGQGTQTIIVTTGPASFNGNITVQTGNASCGGGGTQTLAVTSAPCTNSVCAGSTHNYSVPGVLNATSYTWTVPTGATINSGATTNAINVTFGTASGNVTVSAVDACGASPLQSLAVTVNPLPTATASSNSPLCQGGDLNLTLTSDGTSFVWTGPDGFSSADQNPSIPNAQPAATGTYSAIATNSFGCTKSSSTVATVYENPIISSVTPTNVTCYGGLNGTISITVTNGTSPYNYVWTPGGATTQNLSGVAADTYSVAVSDAHGCGATASNIVITQPDQLQLTCSSNDISCNGLTDGDASVSAIGGTGSYTYLWSPGGATTNSISGLSANTYTVTVTDASGCSASCSRVIVDPPALNVTAGYISPVCDGGDIHLTSNVTGGTGAYTYIWDGSNSFSSTSANPIVFGVTAATYSYTLTVTDARGCLAYGSTEPIVHVRPNENMSIIGANPICNGSSATINVFVVGEGNVTGTLTGGTPFSGFIDPQDGFVSIDILVYPTSNTTYQVATLHDGFCDADPSILSDPINSVDIIVNPSPTVSITPSGSTVLNCNNPSIDLLATPLYPDPATFSYAWDPGLETTDQITVTTANTYVVTVTESNNNCTGSAQIVVTHTPALSMTTCSHTDVTCNGGNDGTATAGTVNNALGTVHYAWSPSGGTNATATGLSAGIYTVTVSDDCSSITCTEVVGEPAALSLGACSHTNVTCFGGSDGSATAGLVSNAVGTPQYVWSPSGGTNATATGLPAGTYTVTVNDNCFTLTCTEVIAQPNQIVVTATPGTILCNGGTTDVEISATGGSGNYSSGTGTITAQAAGSYTYIVTDDNGCTGSVTITITQPDQIVVTAIPGAILCNGGTTDVEISATGGSGTYTSGTGTITAQAAGSYTYTVTDNNGCTGSVTITITQPNQILVTATPGSIACNGGTTGVEVSATGGSGNYTSGTGTITAQAAGSYTYTVTDNNGCTGSTTITISEPVALSLGTCSHSNVTCYGGSNGTATAGAVSNAVGTVHYAWSPSGGTNATATGLSVGTYTVTVNDNCFTLTCTEVITQPTQIVVTATPGTIACNGGTTDVEVSATGGSGNYTSGTGTITAQGAGSHTYTVTDDAGCTGSVTITITEPSVVPAPDVAASNTCGSSVLTASNYTGTLTWSTSETTASITVTVGGTYSVYQTTSPNGCFSAPAVVTATPVNCSSLSAKLFIQGYYRNVGSSTPMDNFGAGGCLKVTGGSANASDVDYVTVHVMNSSSPYAEVTSATGILQTDGSLNVTFTPSLSGTYYVKVTHRNSVETWSKNPVALGYTNTYDFSTGNTQAYGNNQVEVETGVWAIYSGDINNTVTSGAQDGVIESSDYSDEENAVNLALTGYVVSDITGDGLVTTADYNLMQTNVYYTVISIHP